MCKGEDNMKRIILAALVGAEWDAETARIIEWFQTTAPPPQAFKLFPHVKVIHPGR
jgi:hypothetical protein